MSGKQLGGWMVAFGIFAILIGLVGLQFRILWFLDEFGPVVGYSLKGGLVVLGIWIWRNGDRAPVDEDAPTEEEGRRLWVRVAISGVAVAGLVTFIAVRINRDARLEREVNRQAPAASWASAAAKDWPTLVLRQEAQFKNHSALDAGCACLVRLPSGEVVALTAGHLLGDAGGVSPGFLRGGLGGLDPERLATLDAEIVSWKLHPPGNMEPVLNAAGLFGDPAQLVPDCDQVLLRVPRWNAEYPVKPLDLRLKPVEIGERLFVVRCEEQDGEFRQVVLEATRIPQMLFTCLLSEPADLNGCSGSPVVDKDGLLVAIVTGGTLMDALNPSGRVTGFTGHTAAELAPVLKAAMGRKQNEASAKPATRATAPG